MGGKPDGFTIDVQTYTDQQVLRSTEIIKEQLSKIGVTINIKNYDVGTFVNRFFRQQEAPMCITGWPRRPEPSIIAGYSYKSDALYNPGTPSDPRMDALIAKGAGTYEVEKRKPIYRQIDEIVLGEAWYVPMLYSTSFAVAWNHVKGMDMFFGCDAKARLHHLWIDKK